MCRSRPATYFAIVLILDFSFSTVCFALPAGSVGEVGQARGGCHGHCAPMPKPSPVHRCCLAGHEVLSASSVLPSPVSLDAAADHVASTALISEPDAAITIAAQIPNTSPPEVAVLRI